MKAKKSFLLAILIINPLFLLGGETLKSATKVDMEKQSYNAVAVSMGRLEINFWTKLTKEDYLEHKKEVFLLNKGK